MGPATVPVKWTVSIARRVNLQANVGAFKATDLPFNTVIAFKAIDLASRAYWSQLRFISLNRSELSEWRIKWVRCKDQSTYLLVATALRIEY